MSGTTRKICELFVLTAFLCCLSFSAAAQTKISSTENEKIESKLAEAIAFLQANRLDDAEKSLREILSSAPQNVTALTLAGIVADRRSDFPKAEKHFAAAARRAPQSAETRNNYGAVLLKLNRKAEAAREFAASLKINPNQPSALVNLAQIRFGEKNFAAARQLLLTAKNIAADAEILRALILISLATGEKERGAQEFKEYAAVRKASATSAFNEIGLAENLFKNGLLTESQDELEFLLARDAKNIDLLTLLSKVYLAQKNIESAGRLLEAAVAGGIDDARIYAALADVYQSGGFWENAIPAMRLAIDKDPKNELFRVRYGLLLIDSRAPAAAIVRLEEAHRDFPESPKILLALGIAQQLNGRTAEAQSSFERALEFDPKSIPVLAYLALVLDEKGDYAQTVVVTERALAIEEKNAVLHYLLADTILKMPQSDAPRAEKHLRRSLAIDPQLTQAHLALGRLLARQNRWAEAAEQLAAVVKLAPDLADAHYQLGRALLRLKRADESKEAFEKFKKLNETQTARRETTRKELVERLANTRF